MGMTSRGSYGLTLAAEGSLSVSTQPRGKHLLSHRKACIGLALLHNTARHGHGREARQPAGGHPRHQPWQVHGPWHVQRRFSKWAAEPQAGPSWKCLHGGQGIAPVVDPSPDPLACRSVPTFPTATVTISVTCRTEPRTKNAFRSCPVPPNAVCFLRSVALIEGLGRCCSLDAQITFAKLFADIVLNLSGPWPFSFFCDKRL